ncbi:hypothetical protein E5288_WYG017254 [Bos mutus]|uniref:Uncharacterized protein n=1 Tax=Bos mutus TaxID=72004 RepID=A0A6B0S4T2_9CETA|nr:hypothetical protein [Bos mutus]
MHCCFPRMEAASTKISSSYWQETQQNLHMHFEEETLISPPGVRSSSPEGQHPILPHNVSNISPPFISLPFLADELQYQTAVHDGDLDYGH